MAALGEFDLIGRYFGRPGPAASGPGVVLGVGDDCALLAPRPGLQLAVSTDMLVEGRHFVPGVDPESLGHKALAVNLSDLAAMGAEPLACTLGLALPRVDEHWLEGFSRGFLALAAASGCPLVGGDTTRGPLNLCVTVFGQLAPGQALRRDAARAGHEVWVSGQLGDARLALEAARGQWALAPAAQTRVQRRLDWPEPRLALGQALRGVAAAAADVSDGLAGDLGHILKASGVAAALDAPALLACASDELRALGEAAALERVLAGGDDYELVFTAPPGSAAAIARAATAARVAVQRIGRIEAASPNSPLLRVIDAHGHSRPWATAGFDHFSPAPIP